MTTNILNRLEKIQRLVASHGHKSIIVGNAVYAASEWVNVETKEEGEEWEVFTSDTTMTEVYDWLGY